MKLSDFASACGTFWEGYFHRIEEFIRRGEVLMVGGTLLYPTLLLCTQTRNHLIAEFFGASKERRILSIKQRQQTSIREYLAQFPDEDTGNARIYLNASGSHLRNLCLSHEVNFAEAESRFPALRLLETRLVFAESTGCLLKFGPRFSDVTLANCILINTNGAFYRAKYISDLLIVAKNVSRAGLEAILQRYVRRDRFVKGVVTCAPEFEQDYIVGSQLQSLYLTPRLHETTIGEFINQHPTFVKRTLQTDRFVYEPYLEWVDETAKGTDHAINPDLVFENKNKFYDILDLKTALLEKRSLTKGARRRRRFIDAVNEGVAQLANYAEYFQYEDNRAHALSKYDISVESPRLYLIIGHFDNTRRQEVEEALRPYKNLTVFDYDSLVQLYLATAVSQTIESPPQDL